jgi:septum formation protein
MTQMPRRLILASASPRRRELLALLGLPFGVIPTDVHEPEYHRESGVRIDRTPRQYAEELALSKADDLFHRIRFDQLEGLNHLILAADTIVISDSRGEPDVLGKPKDEADARRMLALLSGTAHTVSTAVCLMECTWFDREQDWFPFWKTAIVDTQVQFRPLTDEMIYAYIATGDPMDKAGAYGIQSGAAPFVEAIYGDYFNVVGLPVATVARILEDIGIEWWRGAAALE